MPLPAAVQVQVEDARAMLMQAAFSSASASTESGAEIESRPKMSQTRIEKQLQRELQVILAATVVNSERATNEGEAQALLRRMTHWAILF